MKELRKNGDHAKLVRVILYVNGEPYSPESGYTGEHTTGKVDTPRGNHRQTYKRRQVNSIPDSK